MSFWTKLLILLGIIKNRPDPPTPPQQYRAVAINISGVAGAKVKLDQVGEGVTNQDGYYCWPEVSANYKDQHIWVEAEGYEPYSQHIELIQGAVNQDIFVGAPRWDGSKPTDINLPALVAIYIPPDVVKRTGIVRAQGKHWVDDGGVFFPLGATLFWAIRGWRDERDRIKENIQFLGKYGFNYMRILADVDWKDGLATDSAWPDYEQLFSELVDWAYDECGIRTQVTVLGGDPSLPYQDLFNIVVRVVNARPHKIHFVEVANEGYGGHIKIDINEQRKWGRWLCGKVANLVAVTDPGQEIESDICDEWCAAGDATCGVAHFDRADNTAEWKWRHVRKPWEGRQPKNPFSSNEPGGPHSSVAQYPDVIHLAFCRLVGILCGETDYLLHNGNGIFGVPLGGDGGRKPNLWECEDIDRIMTVLRRLENYLPPDAADGQNTRKGLGPHPFECDAFMQDGNGHGCVRDYAIVNGDHWWQTVFGIQNYVNMKAARNCKVTLIDPVSEETKEVTLSAGESYRLEPGQTRDDHGLGAWIVRGEFI